MANCYVSGWANTLSVCWIWSQPVIIIWNTSTYYVFLPRQKTTHKATWCLFQPNKLHLETLTSSTQLILSTTKIVYVKLCTFLQQQCIFIVYNSWKNSSALFEYSIIKWFDKTIMIWEYHLQHAQGWANLYNILIDCLVITCWFMMQWIWEFNETGIP